MGEVILDVKGLKKYFPIAKGDKKGLFVKAIDGIDFDIREGSRWEWWRVRLRQEHYGL